MSERAQHPFVPLCWLLIQSFWAGSLLGFQWVIMPAIAKSGLAPLLLDELRLTVQPALVSVTSCAVMLQTVLLVKARSLAGFLSDPRGQLLLFVQMLVLAFFVIGIVWPEKYLWQQFCYLAASCSGVLLFLQAAPGSRIARAE